jgi:hypothetical protein
MQVDPYGETVHHACGLRWLVLRAGREEQGVWAHHDTRWASWSPFSLLRLFVSTTHRAPFKLTASVRLVFPPLYSGVSPVTDWVELRDMAFTGKPIRTGDLETDTAILLGMPEIPRTFNDLPVDVTVYPQSITYNDM